MEKTMPIKFVETPTEHQRAGYQVWEDVGLGISVTISEYRVKEDIVQIPGGDKLVGSLQEVQDQLRRRGFMRRADLTMEREKP